MSAPSRTIKKRSLVKILIDQDVNPTTVYLGSEEDGAVINLSDGMPLRTALMGRQKDDVVKYDSPRGPRAAKVVEVIA